MKNNFFIKFSHFFLNLMISLFFVFCLSAWPHALPADTVWGHGIKSLPLDALEFNLSHKKQDYNFDSSLGIAYGWRKNLSLFFDLPYQEGGFFSLTSGASFLFYKTDYEKVSFNSKINWHFENNGDDDCHHKLNRTCLYGDLSLSYSRILNDFNYHLSGGVGFHESGAHNFIYAGVNKSVANNLKLGFELGREYLDETNNLKWFVSPLLFYNFDKIGLNFGFMLPINSHGSIFKLDLSYRF